MRSRVPVVVLRVEQKRPAELAYQPETGSGFVSQYTHWKLELLSA